MRGTNFSQLPDWFVGVAQKDPFVGIGAARLGRSSPPGDAATGTLYARIGWDFATRRGPENGEENH
jgi:hypothetical protein